MQVANEGVAESRGCNVSQSVDGCMYHICNFVNIGGRGMMEARQGSGGIRACNVDKRVKKNNLPLSFTHKDSGFTFQETHNWTFDRHLL